MLPMHPTSPCAHCPFRLDAPRALWAPEEYQQLAAMERSDIGGLFHCHAPAARPSAERGLCAGWLANQKRRGLPSILLRVLLARDMGARAALEVVHDGGHRLFVSIDALVRANRVLPSKRTRAVIERKLHAKASAL